MKTLLKKFNIAQEACRESLYYEVIGHNGKKFNIKIKSMNGNYCGFNNACCLRVMNENGSWDNVVDNHEIGYEFDNDAVYYGNNNAKKESIMLNCAEEFKNYILAVY